MAALSDPSPIEVWALRHAPASGRAERRGAARRALGELLAAALGIDPALWRDEAGRPRSGPAEARGIGFSVSHSGTLSLIAIGERPALGVDVEMLSARRRVLPRALAPPELEEIRSAPDPVHAFLVRWTAKEAFVKALGTGIGGGRELSSLRFSALGTRPLLEGEPGWSFRRVDPGPDAVAVLAAPGAPLEVRLRRRTGATG